MKAKWKWLTPMIPVAILGAGVAITLEFSPWVSPATPSRTDLANVLDLSSQPADIVATYRYVEANPSLAGQIPCYCGCGKAFGHQDLFDCFVISPGVYSSHASGCMVCGNEANDAERLASEGRSARGVRTWIDAEYSKYGPPTDTPKVRN